MAHTRKALSGYFSTALNRELLLLISCPQPFHQYSWIYSFRGLVDSHLIAPPSLHGGEGSFSGSTPPDDIVDSKSMVGVKLGDSGVVIRYQADGPTPGK